MACYSAKIKDFLREPDVESLAHRIQDGADGFASTSTQWDVWKTEIEVLRRNFKDDVFNESVIVFEYTIPRVGSRLDVALLYKGAVFVLEFKGHREKTKGRKEATKANKLQVERYARQLKACHSASCECIIVPIVVSIGSMMCEVQCQPDEFGVLGVSLANEKTLGDVVKEISVKLCLETDVPAWSNSWVDGTYSPTPNIIETTVSRFRNNKVKELRDTGAGANIVSSTVQYLNERIADLRKRAKGARAIFFVTGVPGAGKTLVGLDVVATNLSKDLETGLHAGATFLSGNVPLVEVLSSALQRDAKLVRSGNGQDNIANDYGAMIAPVHNFRNQIIGGIAIDDKGRVVEKPSKIGTIARGVEHLIVFDEAQRAFDLKKFTHKGQYQKENTVLQHPDFPFSEPGFMLWTMAQHPDWSALVCLVGGGQEINTGESGICEWLEWLNRSEYGFDQWEVHVSSQMNGQNYGGFRLDNLLAQIESRGKLMKRDELHLSVTHRSRSAKSDQFVERLLLRDIGASKTKKSLPELWADIVEGADVENRFPIYLTRSVEAARRWLRDMRDNPKTHRYGCRKDRAGFLMSSNAFRLRPLGFPALTQQTFSATADWFLAKKNMINSSDFLEIALHEMFVQGLELDWVGLLWDADFRPCSDASKGWEFYAGISGDAWTANKDERAKRYQLNAYRVLMTRARKGMVIVVPEGDKTGLDKSRCPAFYDSIYDYLRETGIKDLCELPDDDC